MRARGLRSTAVRGWLLIAVALVLSGCGDPERPSIQNVRVSYFQHALSPEEEKWVPLSNGEDCKESPILIEGRITDNTAVVDPRVAIRGERQGVEDKKFSCSLNSGFYECSTSFKAAQLIRGDRISIRESEGETTLQEVEIEVSEIDTYRILRTNVITEGAGDLARSLYKEVQKEVLGGDEVTEKVRMRSGDFLKVGDPKADTLKLFIRVPDSRAFSTLTGTWKRKVLSKWDQIFALNLDPRSGDFSATFQLFDPKPNGSQELETAPKYLFTLSAYDAPDQKKDLGRSAEHPVSLVFSPDEDQPENTFPPEVELSGIDADTGSLTSRSSTWPLSGRVLDNAGEVQWLEIQLTNTAVQGSGYKRIFYFDPARLSLTGDFALNLHFVSDWDGAELGPNGVIDVLEEGKGVSNYLWIVAWDIHGNDVSFPEAFYFDFVPPSTSTSAPAINLVETFPELDANGQVGLPAGEILRIRASATDDSGMPVVEEWTCSPLCPEPQTGSWDKDKFNKDLYDCGTKKPYPTDPAGQFPAEPWEWIDIPSDQLQNRTIYFLKAIKNVRTIGNSTRAPFSAREILHPEDATDPQLAAVLPTETIGPLVAFQELPALADGTVLEPDPEAPPGSFKADFGTLSATIVPQPFSQLNRIAARVIGGTPETRKQPSYDGDTGEFSWNLGQVSVKEGNRVCVGAVSLTGHATLYVWEFDDDAEGEGLRVSLTTSSNPEDCPQESQEFPCPAGSD